MEDTQLLVFELWDAKDEDTKNYEDTVGWDVDPAVCSGAYSVGA